MEKRTFIYSLFCALHFISCASGSTETTETVSRLAHQEHRIFCEMDSLKAVVDQIWAQFNDSLKQGFPQTTSPYIQSKMLEMKNGELLRMFQTYDSLDSGIKTFLQATEEMDRSISRKLDSLGEIGDQIEREKMQLFMELEKKSNESLSLARENYNKILKTECQ